MSPDTATPQTARLERHLRFYRNLSAVLGVVVILLLAVLILGRGQRFGRAIRINEEFICLVKNQEAAQRVHDRVLEQARGDLPGKAAFEEHWEDVSWPVEDNKVLSVEQAIEAVRGAGVHVVIEAATIEVNGVRGVVVPTEEKAKDVLDQVKAQYVSPEDTIVGQQVFLEEVKIAPGQARVEDVVTEIGEAVKLLSRSRREAKQYTVKSGDFKEDIAARHGMTLRELFDLNPGLEGRVIHPGDVLKVSPPTAGITVKTVKEVTREAELEIEVERVQTASVPKGETRVASEGTPPRKLYREHHTYLNDRIDHKEVKSGQIIEEGTPRRILVGTGERPAVGAGDD